jgi:hypothetical protein
MRSRYYADVTADDYTHDHGNANLTKPSGAAKKWLLGLLLVPALVGAGFLAAVLGSDHPLWIVGAVICGLGLFGCFAAVKNNTRSITGGGWAAIGTIVLFSGVWFVVGFANTRTQVYVDNFSEHDLVLELNNQKWLTVNRGQKLEVRLPRKTFELVVRSRETGKELDRRSIRVDNKGPYVLNVLGAHTYYRGSVDYGMSFSFLGGGGPTATEVKDVWIQANVDFLFKEPPSTISVSKGQVSATRTYLTRTPIRGK